MVLPIMNLHPGLPVLAFLQSTQLNLFERFLTQAVAGIDSTSITAGMQKVAYVVLLVGFLWQVYQSALHGGDVRGLGTNLIKYVVTTLVVMNYHSVFTTINQGFVNAGNWIGAASGSGNLFDNWKSDIQTQFSQAGVQQLWGLITGSIAGLLDAILIIVAYLLYPIVIVIFGFFYIFYGSILYIFGPIVIALMPLGATNRLAKSYVENVFVWNAWPVLYGGFGALLSAVQMGQVGQMLSQNSFLGGLGNIEGTFLIGIASIIFSLAIAIIPFIAKRIVTGDVGSTAGAMIGAAVTAMTLGAAAVEGAAVGLTGAGAGNAASSPGAGSAAGASSASANSAASSAAGNQPTRPQAAPPAGASGGQGSSSGQASGSSPNHAGESMADAHAEQMRDSFRAAMGGEETGGASDAQTSGTAESSATSEATENDDTAAEAAGSPGTASAVAQSWRRTGPPASSAGYAKRGPSVHRYNIGTWNTYHAARLTARTLAGGAKNTRDRE